MTHIGRLIKIYLEVLRGTKRNHVRRSRDGQEATARQDSRLRDGNTLVLESSPPTHTHTLTETQTPTHTHMHNEEDCQRV